MPDRDDQQIGHVLSRREVLATVGAAALGGALPRAASARAPGANARTRLPACIVRPAQTEGPYFVDERLLRSDIRSDPTDGSVKAGTPLRLRFQVSRMEGAACAPLAGAWVDVWQCDALGVYAGVTDTNGLFETRGQKFLRGYQVTDAAGTAEFVTIYPGWYPGRCVHVHFKIRTDPAARRGYEFASQLYFDDTLTDRVHAAAPYAEKGSGRRRNEQDGIFRSGGSQLLVDLGPRSDGYAGTFDVGLQIR